MKLGRLISRIARSRLFSHIARAWRPEKRALKASDGRARKTRRKPRRRHQTRISDQNEENVDESAVRTMESEYVGMEQIGNVSDSAAISCDEPFYEIEAPFDENENSDDRMENASDSDGQEGYSLDLNDDLIETPSQEIDPFFYARINAENISPKQKVRWRRKNTNLAQSDIEGVYFNRRSDRWVAQKTKNRKAKTLYKSFNVGKYGFDEARRLAEETRLEWDGFKRKRSDLPHSEIVGVCFHKRAQRWIARGRNEKNGIMHTSFSIRKYGMDGARRMAECARLAWDKGEPFPDYTNIIAGETNGLDDKTNGSEEPQFEKVDANRASEISKKAREDLAAQIREQYTEEDLKSDVFGVYFAESNSSWFAVGQRKRLLNYYRSFSVAKYGMQLARELAEEQRRFWEEKGIIGFQSKPVKGKQAACVKLANSRGTQASIIIERECSELYGLRDSLTDAGESLFNASAQDLEATPMYNESSHQTHNDMEQDDDEFVLAPDFIQSK